MARSDVDALNATFVQALEKGDAALIASLYAPDARVLPPGAERVTGSAAIEQFWQGVTSQGVTGGRLETLALDDLGGRMIEEGRYEIRAGDQLVDVGKYVVVHRRQDDGSWKLDLDIWNSDRPAPSQ